MIHGAVANQMVHNLNESLNNPRRRRLFAELENKNTSLISMFRTLRSHQLCGQEDGFQAKNQLFLSPWLWSRARGKGQSPGREVSQISMKPFVAADKTTNCTEMQMQETGRKVYAPPMKWSIASTAERPSRNVPARSEASLKVLAIISTEIPVISSNRNLKKIWNDNMKPGKALGSLAWPINQSS